MVPFGEEEYQNFMERDVQDWLAHTVKSGRFESTDGMEIQYYYALHSSAKATIVMVHGFCEFFGKYHEVAYNFYDQGYSFFFIENRGHGLSERKISQADLVHVDSFSEYVEDLKNLMDRVVDQKDPDSRKMLFCHSMGGAIGALFLETYPQYFKSALLSSPMLKMSFGGIKPWQARILETVSKIMHWQKKPLPNATPFDPDHPDFEHSASTSKARYLYQFNLRRQGKSAYTMNGGTYGWGMAAMKATKKLRQEAGRVKVPVLICQAGRDEWVDNSGQEEFAQRARHCIIRRLPQAKHEIFNSDKETLTSYYDLVFRFFNKQAKTEEGEARA